MTIIQAPTLERMMQVAQDIKKEFSFDKHHGTWSWFDRNERDNLEAHNAGFPTFLAALEDAVEPYLDESEGE